MNEHTINEPKNGFTFNWLNLFLGAAIRYMMTNGAITDDWTFYLNLGIAVVIHELGHVIMGKSFGCAIKEMQVFLLPLRKLQAETPLVWRLMAEYQMEPGISPAGWRHDVQVTAISL